MRVEGRRKLSGPGKAFICLGLAVMISGIIGGAFRRTAERQMGFGDILTIGPYRLVSQSCTEEDNVGFISEYVLLDVYRDGDPHRVTRLTPSNRFYLSDEHFSNESASHLTGFGELYTTYNGKTKMGEPIVRASFVPLRGWFWAGLCIALLGFCATCIDTNGHPSV